MSVRIIDQASKGDIGRKQMITVFCNRIHTMARRMHFKRCDGVSPRMDRWLTKTLAAGLLSLLAGAGCVIPPPLEKEVDGGVNRPPSILWNSVRPEIGTFTYYMNSDPTKPKTELFNIGFQDLDRQAIHARMFLDGKYDEIIPITNEKTQGGKEEDSILFRVTGLCAVHLKGGTDCVHMLEVYISDGGFIPASTSSLDYRQPLPGGLRDSVAWRLQCSKKSGGQ